MWWVHLPEGYALDTCVRGAQLALAVGREADLEVHISRPAAPWRQLLSSKESALLDLQAPSLEKKEAGLANLMASAAKLLSAGDDDTPVDTPDAITSLYCLPSHAVSPCTAPHTWLVCTSFDPELSVPYQHTFERCFGFAPWHDGPVPHGVQLLPPAVDGDIFKPHTAETVAPNRLRVLVIGQGDTAASVALAQRLLQAGCAHVLLFDPYLGPDGVLPGDITHMVASPPAERARAFRGCSAAIVAAESPHVDNHFLWEAVACGARALGCYMLPGAKAWDDAGLKDAVIAHAANAAPLQDPEVADWRDVAHRLLHAGLPASVTPIFTTPKRAAALPVLLGCHGTDRSRLMQRRHLGINVASNLIWEGVQMAAAGRLQLQWLDYQDADGVRGRFYNYPQGEVEGRGLQEFDYADWPQRLSRGEFDAMFSCDPVADDMLGARQLWSTKALPVISMLHSVHGHGLTFHWLLQVLQYEIFPFDVVISPSRCGATAFRHTYETAAGWLEANTRLPAPPNIRIEVIPYGMERTSFAGLHSGACRHALGLPQDEVLLLSLGRFNKREKADILPLLLALHHMRREGHKVSLMLVGGAAKPAYVQHLRDTVATLGLQGAVRIYDSASVEDKRLILGAADIFVSVSDNVQETYGLAIIEAMAAGLPVVASAWNGAREIVVEGETGFLVDTVWQPPDFDADMVARLGSGVMGYGNRDLHESVVVDIPALTARLTTLVTRPELRKSMGHRGFVRCVADYDLPTQGRRMVELIFELIGQARTHPWQPDRNRIPVMSETARRFAHYPSGNVDDSDKLAISPMGADSVMRRHILMAALDAASPDEFALAHRIIDTAACNPGASVSELSTALAGPDLSFERARLRVVRCWKYGLLQRAGTCS